MSRPHDLSGIDKAPLLLTVPKAARLLAFGKTSKDLALSADLGRRTRTSVNWPERTVHPRRTRAIRRRACPARSDARLVAAATNPRYSGIRALQ